MIAGLLVVPSAALAADSPADVLLDGVVTIVHVDAEDGPIAGATVTVSTWRDPESPIQVLSATTDGSGRAQVNGVARAAEGASPVVLDVRSDLASTLVNEAGCSETASWSAAASTTASASVEVVLDSTSKSVLVDCPEPEPTADSEAPAPTPAPSSGGVLAATGRPQITPPATDTAPPMPGTSRSDGVAGLLAALGLVAVVVARSALAAAGRSRSRR